MEKIRKILKLVYKGEIDDAGMPHGKGVMNYIVEKDPAEDYMFDDQHNLRYKGEFVHGLRQGEGDLHVMGVAYNPVSRYEWYSEGDYDSCGRLIHPSNPEGSYQQYVRMWYPYFEGSWQEDQPLKPRWGDKPLEESVSKMGWQYVRLTTFDAIKDLPLEIENND